MAEIYVPGPVDIMGSANQMMQFRNSQQAQQENAMRMQFAMEDRARAEQARKVAAGNALAEQARKRELLDIYSNFGVTPAVTGQRGQAYSGTGVANDPYAAIQNELLRKGFASQAGDIAELENKNLTGEKTTAEIAGQKETTKGLNIKNINDRLSFVQRFAPSVTTPDSAANYARALAEEFPEFKNLYGSPEDAAARSAESFIKDPAAWQTHSLNLTGEQLVQATERASTAKAPKPQEIDIGGKKIFVDMNPNSPTFKQELTSFDKTLTPADAKPAPPTPTNLAKLLAEQTALPPNSPAYKQYDAAIAKELSGADVAQSTLGKLVTERNRLNPNDPLVKQYDAAIAKEVSGGALSQSPIGKLVAERDALPPGDPLIPQYNAAIAKETGSAGAAIKSEDAIVAAEDLVGKIDALLKHPGKSEAVGISFGTGMVPGTAAKGFISRHDEIKGSAFLDAYNSLRGTGSITEIEGVKATAAKNRMDLSTSEEEYDTAAKEYMGYIKRGIEREKARMQKLVSEPSATAATQTPADIQSILNKY